MDTKVRILQIAIGCWLLAVGGGFLVITHYQNGAGKAGNSPQHWPVGTQVARDSKRDTLLMFVHPQCPCTSASMEELNRLLARSHDKVAVQVWFFSPTNFSENWAQGKLWQSATAIPGVTVHLDRNGAQARFFGAETSGYVLLYDTRGELLFKGGITGSRGHAGDNAGESAVAALLAGGKPVVSQSKVYGCSLLNECKASERIVAR